jgi:hypothetical protein
MAAEKKYPGHPELTAGEATALHSHAVNTFPVGAVFLAVVNTDPNALLGYGTWSQIAQGQFLVGQKATDADFDVAEETGGAKTHTHTDHPATATSTFAATSKLGTSTANTATIGHSHNTPILSHSSPSHLPPYFVVYVWKRTA